jgi:hypothetical protein
MRNDQNEVSIDLAIPADAPDDVQASYKTYRAAVIRLDGERAKLAAAEEELHEAAEKDVRALADAIAAGKDDADPDKLERDARLAKIEQAKRVQACELVVDETGDALLDAVMTFRQQWLDTLHVDVDQAKAKYAAALGDLRRALAVIGAADHDVRWLECFDGSKMGLGKSPPGTSRLLNYQPPPDHPGVRISSRGLPGSSAAGSMFGEDVDAVTLLDVLDGLVTATAGEPVAA